MEHLTRAVGGLPFESVVRIAEPHDYGLRDGIPKLLEYQRQRAVRRDPTVRGWRWLDVAKIEDCTVVEESFSGTRETSHQQHHHWDVLYASGLHHVMRMELTSGVDGRSASSPAENASI